MEAQAARLHTLLQAVRYRDNATATLEKCNVKDLLQILHYALLDYSHLIAEFLSNKKYKLYGKSDVRFIESVFRLARDEFRYFPSLTPAQFLSPHFQKIKLQLVTDILEHIRSKHNELQAQKRRQHAVWREPSTPTPRVRVENHVLSPTISSQTAAILQQIHRQQQGKTNKHVATDASNQQDNNMSYHTSTEPLARQERGHECSCHETVANVHEMVQSLSDQIDRLSSTLTQAVSRLESRVSTLEQQVRPTSRTPPPTYPLAAWPPEPAYFS